MILESSSTINAGEGSVLLSENCTLGDSIGIGKHEEGIETLVLSQQELSQ